MQRKLQRSVREIRRSSITRPKLSFSRDTVRFHLAQPGDAPPGSPGRYPGDPLGAGLTDRRRLLGRGRRFDQLRGLGGGIELLRVKRGLIEEQSPAIEGADLEVARPH